MYMSYYIHIYACIYYISGWIYIPSIIALSSIIVFLSSVHPSISPHPLSIQVGIYHDYDPGSFALTDPALAMSRTVQGKSQL